MDDYSEYELADFDAHLARADELLDSVVDAMANANIEWTTIPLDGETLNSAGSLPEANWPAIDAWAPGEAAHACELGLAGIAALICSKLGKEVWQRALLNTPNNWEETQFVLALKDALQRPHCSPYLRLLTKPIKPNAAAPADHGGMASAWLGSESTLETVLPAAAPRQASKPSTILSHGICKATKPRADTGPWKRILVDAGLHRAAPPSSRPTSASVALKSLRCLKTALATQERALAASKLRGATRRQIGKHSRNGAFERARLAAPVALCGEAEGAARRGCSPQFDESLAALFENGVSVRVQSARQLCGDLKGSPTAWIHETE
jgi:hypothetical protein